MLLNLYTNQLKKYIFSCKKEKKPLLPVVLTSQKASELLERFRNCDDIDSGSSDEKINNKNESDEEYQPQKNLFNSSDDEDHDYDDEADEINSHVVESMESVSQNVNECDENDPSLDKSKTWTNKLCNQTY
ncbi:hypothetical protein BpHYR1_038345 [Brachionus plicatilis]|uniref:Uncharacterized protein n=1 Tax=Brachionus plicatilis TaxID=10195 RepID=A0A3M7RED8_BRAPC|nr:hypothetical protein BpHYR1_038345 [Brachionus plicatilis]